MEKESEAILGKGTALMRGNGDGPPETFTEIAEVGDVSSPEVTSDDVEVTNQQSPGGYLEHIAGLKDPGELQFDVNWLPSHVTHNATTGMAADANSGLIRTWEIRFPDPAHTKVVFRARVKKFAPKAPVKDKMTASVALRVTGALTWGNW